MKNEKLIASKKKMKEFTLKKYNLLSLSILSFIFCYPLSVYGLTKEQEAYYYGVGFGTAGILCELVSYEKISIETALKALAAHTSQVPPEAIERVRAWKSENGKAYNMKYAESFRTFTLR